MDRKVLNAFLYYGYIPCISQINLNSWLPYSLERIEEYSKKWQSVSLEEIVELGSFQLQKIIETNSSKRNILPLSGGLDSRAILGLLLQHYSNEEIKTITCGTPGTWDYDIGTQIANEFNLESKKIDLRSVIWSTEDLISFAGEFDSPIVLLNAFMYSQIFENAEVDALYWIGFMGDPLAGSHLPKQDFTNWTDACKYFSTKERYGDSDWLTEPGFRPSDFVTNKPVLDSTVLNYVEQLDFAYRQKQFIEPQVLQGNYSFKTPFLNQDWINFLLSLPRKYRVNQIAYKEILKFTFPILFAMPTKTNAGLPLCASKVERLITVAKQRAIKILNEIGLHNNYVNPNMNYINFDNEFRSGSLFDVAKENLIDLQQRKILDWVDVDVIWEQHQSGKQNLHKELALLLSLEINIKAGHFK